MFNINFEIEKWKWSDKYNIWTSTLGRFKDKKRKIIDTKITEQGYVLVKAQDENGWMLAHRVIMETWKPLESYNQMSVDHINANKRDNSLKNLEWVSYTENQRRATEMFVDVYKMVLESKTTPPAEIQEIFVQRGLSNAKIKDTIEAKGVDTKLNCNIAKYKPKLAKNVFYPSVLYNKNDKTQFVTFDNYSQMLEHVAKNHHRNYKKDELLRNERAALGGRKSAIKFFAMKDNWGLMLRKEWDERQEMGEKEVVVVKREDIIRR